ncbi:MAG: hypothetical protein ACI92S_001545, partial [Planctomycetaceae bacterium]
SPDFVIPAKAGNQRIHELATFKNGVPGPAFAGPGLCAGMTEPGVGPLKNAGAHSDTGVISTSKSKELNG